MTRDEFEKLKFGTDIVLLDSSLFGVPVAGKALPGYYWYPGTSAKWMFQKTGMGVKVQWCPKSDAEFMARVDLKKEEATLE